MVTCVRDSATVILSRIIAAMVLSHEGMEFSSRMLG